jgi:uncharacterized protein
MAGSRAQVSEVEDISRRRRLRRIGALLCAGIAAVYLLIGAEVVTVAEPSADAGDITTFGVGAAAIFLVGAVLLLTVDLRVVWALGAVLQVVVIGMYLAQGSDRTPSFEAWGLSLRIPQLALLGILTYLALRPAPAGARSSATEVVDPEVVEEFLAQRRIVVVGASDESTNFGRTIYTELRDHGYEVAAVHPSAASVAGDPAHRDLSEVPGPIDGVIVMVHRDHAMPVVQASIDRGVPRIWLFQGAGGAGAVSVEAVELCRRHGVAVVPGACPLMFLQPVATVHRVHRGIRHLNGSLGRTA